MDHLNELKELNLPVGKYAIFGSGPMSVRGIRKSEDIDIIVKNELWDMLVRQRPESLNENPTCLKIGNIEIFRDWMMLSDKVEEMIDSAEIIEGFPFVSLRYVIEWKKRFGRKKDIEDIGLIDAYIRSERTRPVNH